MPEEDDASAAHMPADLCGRWSVMSSVTPDGESYGGEVLDSWEILPDRIRCGEAGELPIATVRADVEADQDLHLVSFRDNSLQFAMLRSSEHPGDVLVVQYLDRQEKMRCLLTRES